MPDLHAPVLPAATPPVTRRVRAFYAPVDRAARTATLFDPAGIAGFDVDAPPAPWVDLGLCTNFVRTSGTEVEALRTGSPTSASAQVRTAIEATVALEFESWGKLQLALASGAQQMNVLAPAAGAAANGSGAQAAPAVALQPGSTASSLQVGAASTQFNVGDVIAVDVDFNGAAGFVGSGASGAYVKASFVADVDADYVRRVSLNVARVIAISNGLLQLGIALPAGVPVEAMKVSRVVSFCDREGGSFFNEWSGLFVLEGEQGDRIAFHYPRLQSMGGAAEVSSLLAKPTLQSLRLLGRFRALPVRDANDGELIVCFRSYLPAALRAV